MIVIEYCDVSSEMMNSGLLGDAFAQAAMDEVKVKVLAKIGVVVQPEETPLAAWLKYLSQINDLPYTTPCHPDLAQTILERTAAARFMFFLS